MFTSLHHLIDGEWMREAYRRTRKDGATGIDGVTAADYEKDLEANLDDLLDRMKSGRYFAPPVRRHYIPKADGTKRPLGIPTFEDKVAQRAILMLLEPIYETDFLPCSYGFRPKRSAHDALDALRKGIIEQRQRWVIDADLKSYFDSVSRDWLVRFLEHRIGDRRVIRLIVKWLKAGVMVDGQWQDTPQGTPQGAIVSATLANAYLHYVLDLWFHRKWRPEEAGGDAIIVRYADDVVVGFEHRRDAERFLHALGERLGQFDLALHPDKTRLIEFGRNAEANRRARGLGRPETFDFLGFTHYCRKTRSGQFGLGRKPAAKRMSRTLKRIAEALRRRMHHDLRQVVRWLGRVVNGWLNYYAVPTSSRFLRSFICILKRIWMKALRRRSQRDRFSWERLQALVDCYWPMPRIRHPWPSVRFAVKHPR